jgi:NhaP-type Na+/H+ or K+/H+ antiporter
VGVAVAWAFSWVQDELTGWRGEAPSLQVVLLRLLLPFGVYLLAERLAVSRILAVVAAGMTVDFTDRHRSSNLAGRMQARGLRAMIEFVFNGLIFLLLALPDGSPFPARDLLIFLASGVILFSLVGGCFGLPIVLCGLQLPRRIRRIPKGARLGPWRRGRPFVRWKRSSD